MTDKERLAKLLEAESYLKRTTAGYTPTGPWWKRGMPLLWEVRVSLGNTPDGLALASAHGILKETEVGYRPTAPRWREAMRIIDKVESNLDTPPVPYLGPVVRGDKALQLYALTHKTAGLYDPPNEPSHFPAVDLGWIVGRDVLAPEPLMVTGQSSAQGADAFFARGDSGIEYWFGHIARAPSNGVRFQRGAQMGDIAWIPDFRGGPHLHCGVNAIALIGKDLKWGRYGNGPDYSYGSPTIGQQLARAMT